MFSIEEAKSAHKHATYHLPVGVEREWGRETIIRELEAEASAVHHAQVGKVKNALIGLYQRIMGDEAKSAPEQQVGPDAALKIGD